MGSSIWWSHGSGKSLIRLSQCLADVQIGALISRKVPPTKTEKAMRRRLAEMKEQSEE